MESNQPIAVHWLAVASAVAAEAQGQEEEERQGQLERRKAAARIFEFKAKEAKRKMLLRGFDVDEDSDKSVAEQLRDALSKSAVRVVDLFKDWDTDGNGKVSKEEFHKAMGLLGFSVPAEDIDALFNSWDPDGSGLLSMDELDKQLSEHKAQLEAQCKVLGGRSKSSDNCRALLPSLFMR